MGGRRNAPTADQLADAIAGLATPTDFLKDTNDFSIVAALVPEASPGNLRAEWRALWDEDSLYVVVDVTDDSFRNDSGDQIWHDDSVEIYVDARGERGASFSANDAQFLFRPFEDGIAYLGGATAGLRDAPGVFPMFVPHAGDAGYTMEVEIPWSTLGLTASQRIGLEIHVNDDDDGGQREGQTSWRTPEADAWDNPNRFTSVDLPITLSKTYTPGAIVVDGLDDEVDWAFRGRHAFERTPAPIVASDNSGHYRSVWDDDFLYFFVAGGVERRVSLLPRRRDR